MSNGDTASGYLSDALMIGKDRSDFRTNTYKVHKDYTSNMPTGCTFGIRRCQQLDSNWTQVIIEEYNPTPGRVWTITYNGTTWTGWSESSLKADLPKYDIKTFTVDVTTQNANSNGKYYTDKKLSTESWYSSAKAIVPLFARKSGGAYICMAEIEYETLRIQADIAISGVTVGILVVS